MAPTAAPARPAAAADGRRAGGDGRQVLGAAARARRPLTLAQSINRALLDVLAADPGALVFGEDVARRAACTASPGPAAAARAGTGVRHAAGRADRSSVWLSAPGVCGLLPIPEIQYLAYLHNAEDQLRGEGATCRSSPTGRYRNPMVVRIAAYGYQKGFGGHFHNDNAVGVLRDIPGLVIASPPARTTRPRCCGPASPAAAVDGTLCVFLEPIALYHPGTCTGRRRRLVRGLRGAGHWAATHVPIGSGPHARRRRRRHHRHLRQRCTDEPAGGRAAGGGRHRRPGARPALARAAPGRRRPPRGARPPVAYSSWTRRGAAAGCPRASSPRSSTPASRAGSRRVTSADSFVPLGAAALHGPAVGGRRRAGR